MVKFTETALSSAQTALIGGQLSREDVMVGAESLSGIPFRAVEVMNPALARVLVERLAENPFERVRVLRKIMPKTALLVSVDVRCGFGDEIIGDGAIERLIHALSEAGVDRIRLLEPTNKVEFIRPALDAIHKAGKSAEVVISLDSNLAGKPGAVVEWAGNLGQKEQFEIILHAENGLLAPKQTEAQVKALKAAGYSVGLSLSTCAGLAGMSGYVAAQAGADYLDTALSPFAGGMSFPPTESMVSALPGNGLDLGQLKKAVQVFDGLRGRLIGVFARDRERIDGRCLFAASASPKSAAKTSRTLDEIKKEHASTFKTPEDALLVLMFGSAGLSLVKGEAKAHPLQPAGVRAYDVEVDGGRYHVEVHPSAVGMVVTPSQRPVPASTSALKPAPRPAPGGGRPAPAGAQSGPSRPAPVPAAASTLPVAAPVAAKPQGSSPRDPDLAAKGGGKPVNVPCPMQGTIVKALVKVGDRVERMSKLIVLEAMKMENDVISPIAGTVTQILVQPGDAVQAGQMLVVIEP
jgi:pyruvate/oxaloacetate carboxyltransferase/biotin carboxyl carrier protein